VPLLNKTTGSTTNGHGIQQYSKIEYTPSSNMEGARRQRATSQTSEEEEVKGGERRLNRSQMPT